MAIGSRLLFVFLTVRLLLPPGVCICKLEAPAARTLAWVFGDERPSSEPDTPDDHEHHPGCPASFLSLGLGMTPAPTPAIDFFPDLPGLAITISVPIRSISSVATKPLDTPCTDPPLFLSHCALTV